LGATSKRFCLAGHDGQATTSQIAEWCRPEIVHAGGKPTAIQIAKHARALRSIGAVKIRRLAAPGAATSGLTKGLAKTIRAMADGSGARICNGLGIMRACLETQRLEQLETRMDEIADRVARDRTSAARETTMKPSALRVERLLAKVEAELACSARPRRYCFYFDEEAEAKAQGLPYALAPRELSREEWEKKYSPPKPSDPRGNRRTLGAPVPSFCTKAGADEQS